VKIIWTTRSLLIRLKSIIPCRCTGRRRCRGTSRCRCSPGRTGSAAHRPGPCRLGFPASMEIGETDQRCRIVKQGRKTREGAEAGRAYDDGVSEVVGEVVPEGAHEVGVALDGRAALEHGHGVATERDVLGVAVAPLVGVAEVVVPLHLLHHPPRQRDAVAHATPSVSTPR
jgi:hypothetical protein